MHPLLELGGEALDRAVEADVVHRHAAVGEHALEVAVADRELQVPSDRPRPEEAEAVKRPGIGHEQRSRIGGSVGAPLLPGYRPPLKRNGTAGTLRVREVSCLWG